MEKESITKGERKITEHKQKIKPKQTKLAQSDTDVKKSWKNSIKNLLLPPLIKHQTISHLFVENTTFPNH